MAEGATSNNVERRPMVTRFTLLDWVLVAIVLFATLRGLGHGGCSVLTVGFGRVLTSLVVGQGLILGMVLPRRAALEALATQNGLPPAMAMTGAAIAAAALAYIVIGPVGRGLTKVLDATAVSRAIDRILGLPAGFVVGVWIAVLLIVAPVQVYRSYYRGAEVPVSVRDSVLLPMAQIYGDRILGAILGHPVDGSGARRSDPHALLDVKGRLG